MKTKILIALSLIIVAGLGYYFFVQNKKQALAPEKNGQDVLQNHVPENNGATANPQNSSSTRPGANNPAPQDDGASRGQFSSGEEGDAGADILVVQVNFDGTSFSPKTQEIKAGDVVIFKNNSTKDFYPVVDQGLIADYPEFDAKAAISPGGKFQFKFEKAGTWNFYDRLDPSATGTIKVSGK
jgi:plastocyanin